MSKTTIRVVVELRNNDICFAVCDNTDADIEIEVYSFNLQKDDVDEVPIPVALDSSLTRLILDGCPKCGIKITYSTCPTCNSFGCADCDGLGYSHCSECKEQREFFHESSGENTQP